MKSAIAGIMILLYATQNGIIVSVTPSKSKSGSRANVRTMDETTPIPIRTYAKNEKRPFARFVSPSPKTFPTRALPPVPNMKPTAAMIIKIGET